MPFLQPLAHTMQHEEKRRGLCLGIEGLGRGDGPLTQVMLGTVTEITEDLTLSSQNLLSYLWLEIGFNGSHTSQLGIVFPGGPCQVVVDGSFTATESLFGPVSLSAPALSLPMNVSEHMKPLIGQSMGAHLCGVHLI